MAKTFNNQAELDAYLNSILDKVLDNVAQKLLIYMQVILDQHLYNNGHSDSSYKHLYDKGGFYAGWTIEKSRRYVRTLLFDPSRLALDKNHFSHMGNGNEDVRYLMPLILDDFSYDEKLSSFGGSNYRFNNPGEASYWDMFQKYLDRSIIQWFDEEFGKYGIKRG